MKKDRNPLWAGLFIVGTAVLAVGIVVTIGGGGQFNEAEQTRTAVFPLGADLGGLRAGDEVRVGGLKVGAIRDIQPAGLDTDDPRLVVTFRLPAKFKFREEARVGVQTTLTGSSVLNVETLGKGKELDPAEQLAGRPDPKSRLFASLDTAGADVALIAKDFRTQTMPKVHETVDTYKQTGESARRLIEQVQGKVDPAVGKYNMVADKTGGMMDSVREMIGPSTRDFHGTMADLKEITGNLRTELPVMLAKVQGSIDNAKTALEDVQKTAANTKDISVSVRSVLAGNKGKLEGIFASVKTTGDNLKAASAEIRRSPWRLLYQPKQEEMSNLNLYDSARQFADGANELNDAAQALRDALNNKDADKEQLQKLVNRLEKTFVNFRDVEDKLWQGVKE